MMSDITNGIFVFGLFATPVILVLVDMILGLKKQKSLIFEIIAFGVGFIYMGLCFMLWDPPIYSQPIYKMAGYGTADFSSVHEPVSREHVLTLLVIAMIGFVAYLKICGAAFGSFGKGILYRGILRWCDRQCAVSDTAFVRRKAHRYISGAGDQ